LTNHSLIRLSAARLGIRAFTDYIVLGDDVVIARKEVAMEYRKVINSIGVFISEHKSINPSELNGLEFASKLINSEGNLSPLPVILLRKKGLVYKIQFLSHCVERLLVSGFHDIPDLDHFFKVVFGPKLKDSLGDLFCRYFVFSKYSKLQPNDLINGVVPEPLPNLDKVTQFQPLYDVFNTCHIENIIHCLDLLSKFVLKLLNKCTQELTNSLIKDNVPIIMNKLNDLSPERDLQSTEGFTSFCVNFSHYISGPSKYFIIEIFMSIDKIEKLGGKPFADSTIIFNNVEDHESFTSLDIKLDRDTLKILDSLSR